MLLSSESVVDISDLGANLKNALHHARLVASESQVSFRHGAVLFRKGRIYGRGCNKYRTIAWAWRQASRGLDDEVRLNNMHAETSCMHNVSRDLISRKDIFVVRINPSFLLRQSRPCPSCLLNMRRKKIRRVYYSIDATSIGLIKF